MDPGGRMIGEYHVYWILHNGENMVNKCTQSTHTHNADDSNHANFVHGLNAVVSAIQAARPKRPRGELRGRRQQDDVQHGEELRHLTKDASGSLGSRRAAHGVTFPFSPRHAERYMPNSNGSP